MNADNGGSDDRIPPAMRNPLNWLIFTGMLLIVSIAIGTAFTVNNFRQRALDSAERGLENTALLLARHFDRELQNFEEPQKQLAVRLEQLAIDSPDAFRRAIATEQTHKKLEEVVNAAGEISGINVFDATGQLANSSKSWPIPNVNISDRAYFKQFASDAYSPAVLLEAVHSRFSGGWATIVARKVVSPTGRLLGVITRGISPANLESFFESLNVGKGSSISLLHRDGTLLARYPHIESMIGQNFKTAPVQQLLSKAEFGTIRLISPIDGEDRLASTRALSEFPLSVIVTTTVAAALDDWRSQTRLLVLAAGLAALAIAFTLFAIVRKLSRQHAESERQLALEKERLGTAIDNMSQGLLLYDSEAKLVLSNRRYLEMYNLSADVVRPGLGFRDLIAYRKKTGSFPGDVDQFCSTVLRKVELKQATSTIVETADGRSVHIINQPLENGGWVATQEDITDRIEAEKRIAHLAHYDALTDLPNRVSFHTRLEQELVRARRGEGLALLYIDIDEFKLVNDTLGHPAGDELLKTIAQRLRYCVRESDIVARLGGDEFVVVQTNVKQASDVLEFVQRIHAAIREPIDCLGQLVATDASIGIALAPDDASERDQLLKNADLAMYSAKGEGGRAYRFFEPEMDARAKARHAIEADLREAIVKQAFEVHYQPILNLESNRIVCCEALLRWNHPDRGMISPTDFIPIAEETGLINQIGDWVLERACSEAARWPDDIRIAVNVSPVQFRNPGFGLKVTHLLATTGLAPDRLELEITEATVVRDDQATIKILDQLRAIGVRIALDDFGTGYSSLGYLQRFPFDKIKIDRSFINDLAHGNGSSSIVEAVINIARGRNMTTTAEGVEWESQRHELKSLGCSEMQGYLFSPARPAHDIRELLSKREHRVVA